MSARTRVEVPPALRDLVEPRRAGMTSPFVGITTDGVPLPGLRTLGEPRVPTDLLTAAALEFLDALTPKQRERVRRPMDSNDWRAWINVHMNFDRHGLLLEELEQSVRDKALALLQETLSARGYDQARGIMRLNELVAEMLDDWDQYGEWPYFVTIFGAPGGEDPWGWQIDGHHLCLSTVVFDGRVTMTPAFMGSEPRRGTVGAYAGISLFDPEEALGLAVIRSLDESQQSRAIVHRSIHPDDLPDLQHQFDGRQVGGAGNDNAVVPYQGVSGTEMTDAQRRLVLELARVYLGWSAEPHAQVSMREVEAHLDETWFSWYGGFGDADPFYYRVHSPVILIEFDHHQGIIFDNDVPTRHHIHTIVRTPNGGDYGADLLRQHHERFEHVKGRHIPR